jgi:hypothetical protein
LDCGLFIGTIGASYCGAIFGKAILLAPESLRGISYAMLGRNIRMPKLFDGAKKRGHGGYLRVIHWKGIAPGCELFVF